jgi:glutamate synthase (NADPH/NADH)
VPKPPETRTDKRIAVIGSGPAGLAAADQLNKVGHHVTVYERADRTGGLLMYGVPNMKLDKHGILDRRVDIMREEGVELVTNAHIGSSDNPDHSVKNIMSKYDAVVLALGATKPRDLPIEGRKLKGIYFAMEFLYASTKSLLDNDQKYGSQDHIDAKDKNVIVIGGGDTGNDCIGTSVRMGAKSVVNFELLPQPPETRGPGNPWPQWPRIYRVDYGHEEVKAIQGKDPREYSIMSKRFIGDKNNEKLVGVETVQIQWDKNDAGEWQMKEIEGSNKVWDADLVFLSMGFTGPETPITQELNCDLDGRGNIRADRASYRTSVGRVFACGDARRGQSLIVHAIAEGRQCAREVDRFLSKKTYLP